MPESVDPKSILLLQYSPTTCYHNPIFDRYNLNNTFSDLHIPHFPRHLKKVNILKKQLVLDVRNSLSFLAILDQYATLTFLEILTKWLPSAILNIRNSLSIAFLAISDRYTTLFFLTKWLPSAILDVRNSLSIAFLAILDQYGIVFIFIFLQNGRRRTFWMFENHF